MLCAPAEERRNRSFAGNASDQTAAHPGAATSTVAGPVRVRAVEWLQFHRENADSLAECGSDSRDLTWRHGFRSDLLLISMQRRSRILVAGMGRSSDWSERDRSRINDSDEPKRKANGRTT